MVLFFAAPARRIFCVILPRLIKNVVLFLYIFIVLVVTNMICVSVSGINVTLITIHVGANPFYGYYKSVPVYRVAAKHIRERYPDSLRNLTHVAFYLAGYDLCGDGGDHAAEFFSKVYYENLQLFDTKIGFPVLASPECSSQTMQLGDLARELHLPFFTSVSGDVRLTNKIRYSTTSAIATLAGPDVVASIQALMERFNWTTIALICDDMSHLPGLSNFFVQQCVDIKKLFATQKYVWSVTQMDTAKSRNFSIYLFDLKSGNRIFFILTVSGYLRDIMVEAYKLNMTSGNYVFISLQPTRRPGIYPVMWKADSDTDSAAFDAFKNLIILTGVNPNWTEIKNLTSDITVEGVKLFNLSTSPADEENELQISIYESTMMFAETFDKFYPDSLTMKKSEFIRKTFNGTFTYASRTYYTGPNGAMVNLITVFRLNLESKNMELAMTFNPVLKEFYGINPDLWYWTNRNGPPPDRPRCLSKDECGTDTKAFSGALIGGVATSVLLILVVAGCVLFRIRQKDGSGNLWWLIDFDSLISPENQATSVNQYYETLVKQMVGTRMRYHHQEVYALEVQPAETKDLHFIQKLMRNRDFLETMHKLRRLRHINIAQFIGDVFKTSYVLLISEYGFKKTLRELLKNDQVALDSELKFSLCWDLIEGLEFIHQSHFSYHGNLNSFICIIDSRFGLKISQTGYVALLEILESEIRDEKQTAVELLWKPPEVLLARENLVAAKKLSRTKESDMYSVGVIFYEVFTRSLPFGASLASIQSVQAALKNLQDTGLASAVTSIVDIPIELIVLLDSCLSSLDKRPSAKAFSFLLRSIKKRSKNPVDHMLKRLEIYAASLETVVAERTAQLENERQVADSLLHEMLPEMAMRTLRDKKTVPCESFDCVTIMFSDLPIFEKVMAVCSPMEIIVFLNTIYSAFDAIIPAYDVYKLETINDSYVVVSGLTNQVQSDHAFQICRLAIAMENASREIPDPTSSKQFIQMRVGINTGPIVAGVIGVKMPRYCLFGDTMNTASRMESHGEGGKIHIHMKTKEQIESNAEFYTESRGLIPIKGKGLMETFWLTSSDVYLVMLS